MFDVQAARKAGANEDQIIQYLTQTRKYDVPGALKAGASKTQLIDYLSSTQPGGTSQQQPAAKSFSSARGTGFKMDSKGIADPLLGAAKSFAKPILNAGKLVAKVTGTPLPGVDRVDQALQYSNTSQKVGGVVGDIAQFFLPVGEAAKGAGFVEKLAVNAGRNGILGGLQAGSGKEGVKAAGISAGIDSLFGIAGKVAKGIPRLLSYTSDIPQEAIDRIIKQPAALERGAQPITQTLSEAQSAVKGLRRTLTDSYKEGRDALIKQFGGDLERGLPAVRTGFNEGETKFLQKIANDFNIDLPDNASNLSLNEALDLYKEINELYSKPLLRSSAAGVPIRKAQELIRSRMTSAFGGKTGPVSQFLSNYSTEKTVHDAANDLLNAYKLKKPKAQTSALSSLKMAYNENKPAYLSALSQLEEKTGINFLDAVAGAKFQNWLPDSADKGIKRFAQLVALPLTSPRLVGKAVTSLPKAASVVRPASKLLTGGLSRLLRQSSQ